MVSEKRLRKLNDPAYREEYLKSTVTGWIVHQLRALRGERRWTQTDLAKKAGMPQSAVGRYESEGYGNWSINTLLKLAKAFDVALEVRFVSWPRFMRNSANTSPEVMYTPSFSTADFKAGTSVYQRFSTTPVEQKPARSGPPADRLGEPYYRQEHQVTSMGLN